jgi:hypothetical protein
MVVWFVIFYNKQTKILDSVFENGYFSGHFELEWNFLRLLRFLSFLYLFLHSSFPSFFIVRTLLLAFVLRSHY